MSVGKKKLSVGKKTVGRLEKNCRLKKKFVCWKKKSSFVSWTKFLMIGTIVLAFWPRVALGTGPKTETQTEKRPKREKQTPFSSVLIPSPGRGRGRGGGTLGF